MNFADLSQKELCEQVEAMLLPKFRGKQLFDAILNGQELDEISVFSQKLKQIFEKNYPKYKIFKKLKPKTAQKNILFNLKTEPWLNVCL